MNGRCMVGGVSLLMFEAPVEPLGGDDPLQEIEVGLAVLEPYFLNRSGSNRDQFEFQRAHPGRDVD